MAINYDNAVVNLSIGSTTNNATLTVGSGNTILFAGVFCTVGDDLTTFTATKGGVDTNMTLIDKIANGTEECYLYYIFSPDSGSVTVKATFSVSVVSRLHVSTYTGAQQSGVPDAKNKGTYITTPVSPTNTTVADNCWNVLFVRGGTISANSGITERPSAAASSSAIFDTNGPKTPAGLTTVTFDDSGTAGSWIMASFPPVAVAATTHNLSLLGAGT